MTFREISAPIRPPTEAVAKTAPRVATALQHRCTVLADALARELPDWTLLRLPEGGLHLWLRLPPGLTEAEVADAAPAHRITVNPGHQYFPAEPPAAHLRLGFAAAAEPADPTEAAARLAAAVGGWAGGRVGE